jgi:hypothetical protein
MKNGKFHCYETGQEPRLESEFNGDQKNCSTHVFIGADVSLRSCHFANNHEHCG